MNLDTKPYDYCQKDYKKERNEGQQNFDESISAAALRLVVEQARLGAFVAWAVQAVHY